MNGAPRVSVVIPCYNLGRYVDEAVDSVLAQGFQDFEILIVDDGSEDPDTSRLFSDYRRPKTRVFRVPHAGLAAARNFGLSRAAGEYLCALDADDKLDASFLEKTVAVLDGDRSLTFASAWLRTFGDEEWEWRQDRCDLPTLLSEDTVLTAALVRRAAVQELGGWDGGMSAQGNEDWDLWLSLVERGHRGIILPEVLFLYRRRAGSMSEVCTRGEAHLGCVRHMIAKHRQSYRRHLTEVLLRKEADIGGLIRETGELVREVEERLVPDLVQREEQLSMLRRKLEALRTEGEGGRRASRLEALESRLQQEAKRIAELEDALARKECDTRELKDSLSWRATAPFRALHRQLVRLGKGLGFLRSRA